MGPSRTTYAFLVLLILPGLLLAETDLDLYMLRLVNRARSDPAGEAQRIESNVEDARAPSPPLAYQLDVAQAAANHEAWMRLNLGSIGSGTAPDSLTSFETWDGSLSGLPASGSIGFTGVTVPDRLAAAGYPTSYEAENINALADDQPIYLTTSLIEYHHLAWWEDSEARDAMLNSFYTAFGFATASRAFDAPLGGLTPPLSHVNFATQDYGRPADFPRNYVSGLIYQDLNGDGQWTPAPSSTIHREGLQNLSYIVYFAGTNSIVTTGTTMDNGAFSSRLSNGSYRFEFFVPDSLAGPILVLEEINLAGQNVDAGDYSIPSPPLTVPADFDADGDVDEDDYERFEACTTGPEVPFLPQNPPQGCDLPLDAQNRSVADFDHDGDVDQQDFGIGFQRCYSGDDIMASYNCVTP